MSPAAGLLSLAALAAAVVYGWRRWSLRELALARLGEFDALATADAAARPRLPSGPLARRWRWLPWLLGLMVAALLYAIAGFWLIYSAAIGLIAGLLASELESYVYVRRAARLEAQLADAIDLMIGALGAGAGVTSALAAAAQESRQPLKGQLEDLLARIRLGDSPQQVFRALAARVPLETFTLLATALAVHWEVGGSLTPTLAMVGRTIRDRIEISRRIHSNIAQSQLSTAFVLLLTYFIAAIVWRNSPAQMAAFLTTDVGSFFIAGSMVLQCAGIVWMNWISRPKF
jgi:tight adherence protein B